MYEELIQSLREKAEFLTVSDVQKAPPGLNIKNLFAETMSKAADAIEEMRELVEIYEDRQRWVPVTDNNLPDEGEEVLVYDGCYRVAKIEKGISVDERERMKRGEIPDPEEWGWNAARGYFRVRRSEAYKGCDEQGNNEKPYCWLVDNGKGTLFGQDVKYWMPLFKPRKAITVNEITPEMIEAAERNEKRIKERVDRIYDELIAEKRAEIERLKAEIAQMPPLDYDKLTENPPEYPVCVGYKCWDGKEADNDNKNL